EWIYPVPKNLLSPDYLLQLGRKRAIDSIIHGVPGGPMPPWGELGKGKPFDHSTPVLTQLEIEQLVDWIFDQLPEQPGESNESEAPKWRYTPNDVLRELEREEKPLPLSSRPVALMGELKGSEKPSVTSLFTVRKNAKGEEAYDLNRSLYTSENLTEGERLFTEHCAICHGSSGGGNGPRAATMAEAKPRMLSHLPWIRERDDLRLLRSIKYGVKGTSMSAWGDSTSPLQRIQMLLYIRHLTDQAALRSAIESALYDTYEVAEQTISKQRQVFARDVLAAQNALDSAKNALADAERGNSPNALTEAWKSYQRAQEKLQTLKHTDEILSSLILLLRSENAEASALGQRLLMGDREGLWDPQFIEWIESQASRWEFASGGLALQESPEERKNASERLISLQLRYELALKGIDQLEAVTNGMLPSLERTEKLKELEQRRKVLTELIGEIQQRSAAIERLQTSEATLYQSFKASLEAQQ
ncbi:MAG: cytochrome c, partial [Chlamydiia bacterium]|nr:cytochrome c [Chlamydiia bacterium]